MSYYFQPHLIIVPLVCVCSTCDERAHYVCVYVPHAMSVLDVVCVWGLKVICMLKMLRNVRACVHVSHRKNTPLALMGYKGQGVGQRARGKGHPIQTIPHAYKSTVVVPCPWFFWCNMLTTLAFVSLVIIQSPLTHFLFFILWHIQMNNIASQF